MPLLATVRAAMKSVGRLNSNLSLTCGLIASRFATADQMIIDLLGGVETPLEGAVAIAPHLTVSVVPNVPLFISSATLLENLLYGCMDQSAAFEPTVWSVAHALGLPSHIFNPKGGRMPMGSIMLSSSECQLFAIARTILTQPDMLLVHDIGALEPGQASRLGKIFASYVAGSALTRLGAVSADVLLNSMHLHRHRRTVIWHARLNVLQDAGVEDEQMHVYHNGSLVSHKHYEALAAQSHSSVARKYSSAHSSDT
jgi:hypothetical protein